MPALNVLICRVCSFTSDDNESIYEENKELNGIGEQLSECIGLILEAGDGYPERICNPCRMQLGMFYNFKLAAIRMHERYTKTLSETIASEPKKEVAVKKLIRKSASTKPMSVRKSPAQTPITNYQKISIREPLPDSSTVIFEQCKSVKLDIEKQDQYSPTETNNILEDDENEIENTFSEEQLIMEEDNDSPNRSYDQIKKESIEMDEIYLEDEFHEPVDNEAEEEEENYAVSEEIPKEDESFKVNSAEESNDSDDPFSNMKIKILPGEDQLFRCSKCPMTFPARHRLIAHMQRHTNKRPVPCSRCEKSFKNKYDLKIHYRCHDDLRKYVCDICNKSFRAYTHMTNHKESHAVENTLQCSHCDQMYKTTMTLRRHIESMHTNRFDYVCPFEQCKKAFGLKFRLQRHMKTHQNKMEAEYS